MSEIKVVYDGQKCCVQAHGFLGGSSSLFNVKVESSAFRFVLSTSIPEKHEITRLPVYVCLRHTILVCVVSSSC